MYFGYKTLVGKLKFLLVKIFQILNWAVTYLYWSSLALGQLIALLSFYYITNVFQKFVLRNSHPPPPQTILLKKTITSVLAYT